MSDRLTIMCGESLAMLKTLESESVQCCVTSPPYWGLRDYGVMGQLGMEKTPEEYTAKLVAIFTEVWRVLKPDATLWLNLGDCFARNPSKGIKFEAGNADIKDRQSEEGNCGPDVPRGLKPKDLVGIPWRVAFAMQAAGWYLRSDIIWAKPNPMPESVTDRPTRSHEYIFLLTKSAKYYYDADAIAEPLAYTSVDRLSQDGIDKQEGSDMVPGKTNGNMKAVYKEPYNGKSAKDYASGKAQDASATKARIVDRILSGDIVTRNKRSVWMVSTAVFRDAHFATFNPDLIKPCILAGTKPGDIVLDPFLGSGTTAMVALELGRRAIGIDLNPEYCKMAERRCDIPIGFELI